MAGGRFRELFRKYGKVALGVHFSVSGATIAGLYVAINNNVDVEAMLEKVGMGGVSNSTSFKKKQEEEEGSAAVNPQQERRNRTVEVAASSGGALALAFLCNKALFPVRVPITIALTPPIARFLARRSSSIIIPK